MRNLFIFLVTVGGMTFQSASNASIFDRGSKTTVQCRPTNIWFFGSDTNKPPLYRDMTDWPVKDAGDFPNDPNHRYTWNGFNVVLVAEGKDINEATAAAHEAALQDFINEKNCAQNDCIRPSEHLNVVSFSVYELVCRSKTVKAATKLFSESTAYGKDTIIFNASEQWKHLEGERNNFDWKAHGL